MRPLFTALSVILLVPLLVPGWSRDERLPIFDGTPKVTVTRVPLDAIDASARRVGALTYLGGIRLASRDPAFGGFSALAIEGTRFTLLSDGGLVFRFAMGGDLRPRDFGFGALPDGPGTGWSKEERDSESLAIDPTTGTAWVGFERANAIWRYSSGLARSEAARAPAEMRRWPKNAGAEALVRLSDGRFLVFAEDRRAPGGGTEALRFDRDPTDPRARAERFVYDAPAGYRPTDAAELPDGRLLVLNRAISLADGFTATLAVVDSQAIRERASIGGREVARFAYPNVHDNFEGVAITREGAATIVWLLSDDNGPTWFQRTLLLKFRLHLPQAD